MANKRQLKKFVTNTCGALAAEIILARAAFPEIDRKAVYDIISKIAATQQETLAKASISFDKARRDFDNAAEYRKAHREYYNTAYTKLLDAFDAKINEILKEMNAALPENVRATLKVTAAE